MRDSESRISVRCLDERGVALFGLIGSILILAIVAAVVITKLQSPIAAPQVRNGNPGVTTPISPSSGASVASTTACKADFLTLTAAVQTYRTLNGGLPPKGTSWATGSSSSGNLLQSWPRISGLTFTWNGSTVNVVPAKGTASVGTFGTSTPPTGCFAN